MNAKMKSLIGYILPALGGLFVTYLYNVVDGIFVGQGVGSAALGAVNIAVPFITSITAVTAMVPMGGATVVAIRMGRGDKEGANHAFMTAFSLTLLISVILMTVGMVFSHEIVDMSGARQLSAEMREMSAQYLFYCSAFSIPMLIGTCLSVFVRNDGSPHAVLYRDVRRRCGKHLSRLAVHLSLQNGHCRRGRCVRAGTGSDRPCAADALCAEKRRSAVQAL